jgi:hypothetical protein
LPGYDTVTVEVTFLARAGRQTQRYENISLAEYRGSSFRVQQH